MSPSQASETCASASSATSANGKIIAARMLSVKQRFDPTCVAQARGAGGSIKPGVERSETPGLQTKQTKRAERAIAQTP